MTAIPPCCSHRALLAETRNFDGTVHFIFQPAEEGLGGARAMIKDRAVREVSLRRGLRACTTRPI